MQTADDRHQMLSVKMTAERADLALQALAAFSREQIMAGASLEVANATVDAYRALAAQVRGPGFGHLPYFTEANLTPEERAARAEAA